MRSHASTISSNMLVVSGGITENLKYINKIHFLPLNTANLSDTNPAAFTINNVSEKGLAYHKIVNTFDIF
jgi:hypothetical protein